MDVCDLIREMRAYFFAKDRDVWLQAGRTFNPSGPTCGLVPIGGIIIWSGTVANIPACWQICDGTNGTPNMTGRFIVHADADAAGTYNVGDTGGADSVNLQHNHGAATGGEASHTHGVGTLGTNASASCITKYTGTETSVSLCAHTHAVTGNTGAGSNHTHTISNDLLAATENRPLYYALAYIRRMT